MIYCPLNTSYPAKHRYFFTELNVSFQIVSHALTFGNLIRYVNTNLPKSCSESKKLLKVAKIEKGCF